MKNQNLNDFRNFIQKVQEIINRVKQWFLKHQKVFRWLLRVFKIMWWLYNN